jgi:hypothetical protein
VKLPNGFVTTTDTGQFNYWSWEIAFGNTLSVGGRHQYQDFN